MSRLVKYSTIIPIKTTRRTRIVLTLKEKDYMHIGGRASLKVEIGKNTGVNSASSFKNFDYKTLN